MSGDDPRALLDELEDAYAEAMGALNAAALDRDNARTERDLAHLEVAERTEERDRARETAVRLEQELAETRQRLLRIRRLLIPENLTADEVIDLIFDAEVLA